MTASAIHAKRAVLLAAFSLSMLFAVSLRADIYHYVDSEGNHVFTTYRVRGMELIETIESPDTSSSSSSSRTRARSNRSSSSRPRARYDESAFDDTIREAAIAFNLPFEFIKAVIKAESAFNPRAVSRAGAEGLMQLMPGTAEEMGVDDSFEPRDNIFGGSRYLRWLADRYDGDINLVLSAYNAGPGAVESNGGIPYEATRRYVQTVYRYYQEYQQPAPSEGD